MNWRRTERQKDRQTDRLREEEKCGGWSEEGESEEKKKGRAGVGREDSASGVKGGGNEEALHEEQGTEERARGLHFSLCFFYFHLFVVVFVLVFILLFVLVLVLVFVLIFAFLSAFFFPFLTWVMSLRVLTLRLDASA